jgi:hypothetical protein
MALFSALVAWSTASFSFLFAEDLPHWAKKAAKIKIKSSFLFIHAYYIPV